MCLIKANYVHYIHDKFIRKSLPEYLFVIFANRKGHTKIVYAVQLRNHLKSAKNEKKSQIDMQNWHYVDIGSASITCQNLDRNVGMV